MSISNPVINKVFNDLDAYRDYCRFEGKVFNEKALYNKEDPNWQAYEKYRNYLRSKNKSGFRPNNNGYRSQTGDRPKFNRNQTQ